MNVTVYVCIIMQVSCKYSNIGKLKDFHGQMSYGVIDFVTLSPEEQQALSELTDISEGRTAKVIWRDRFAPKNL